MEQRILQEVVALCDALGRNTVLQELYASGHHLTVESATAVAEMLGKNSTLRSLCVGDDALGDSVNKRAADASAMHP